MKVEPELHDEARVLIEWNDWVYTRWNSLTDDARKKATTWSKDKWKKKTAQCGAGSKPQYSINPDEPIALDDADDD